jgi:predicted metallopeptidase
MVIKYYDAPDVKKLVEEIVNRLEFSHIDCNRIYCFRSKGSNSKYVTARIYTLPKIMQMALKIPPHYAIEVISEKYDKLGEKDKEKIIIHELLHIPYGFLGGFRHHKGHIDEKRVKDLYKILKEKRNGCICKNRC